MSAEAYRVENRDGCTVVYGQIPVCDLVPILEEYGAGGVLDTHLADMLDANVAVGYPEALAREREKATPACLEAATSRYGESALSHEAVRWLAIGEQGMSSRAMFAYLTGISPPRSCTHDNRATLPTDADDFSRCYRLYQDVPEVRERFEQLASLSPQWASLVAQWPKLAELFEQGGGRELTDWLGDLVASDQPRALPGP